MTATAGTASAPAQKTVAIAEWEELSRRAGERDRFLEMLQFCRADFENYQKRIEKDRALWTVRARGDVVRDLLPVIDDIERLSRQAGGTAPEVLEALRQGVLLLSRTLAAQLKKNGIEPVEVEKGKPLDPRWQEAVLSEPSAGMVPGSVLEQLEKGYRYGEVLLRPARVKVAMAVPVAENGSPEK